MGIPKTSNSNADFLPGTLEMLILKTLSRGANHGFGIAQHIQQVSQDALRIGEGSLYPALQRLLLHEFVEADWGVTENNRRARYYTLTAAGHKHLAAERKAFARIVGAIQLVLTNA